MVFEILDNNNIEKIEKFLKENNIEFKAKESVYIMNLEEDIIGTWDCSIHDEDISDDILKEALNRIKKDDNIYEDYYYRIFCHLNEVEKEYCKE